MKFCFYPKHEHACPNVSHCPHLGGAALGTLVLAASDHDDHFKMIYSRLDAERERNTELAEENEKLRKELDQVRLKLKLERQNKFACGRGGKADAEEDSEAQTTAAPETKTPGKRGAPVGHTGWFRPTPTVYDHLALVPPPQRCPHCQGGVRLYKDADPYDHFQEDIVDHRHQLPQGSAGAGGNVRVLLRAGFPDRFGKSAGRVGETRRGRHCEKDRRQ